MLRPRERQGSFHDTDYICEQLIPQDSFYQKFTAREDDGTGLYYYRARYYSPEMGRFISEDPIGFGGGDVNFYAYVGNNPVNFNDPSGLWSFSLEGYYGLGGGFVFGKNPDGSFFLTFRGGYGIGGGAQFNPFGQSAGYTDSPDNWMFNVEAGCFGEASAGLGPAFAGIGANIGMTGRYESISGYYGFEPVAGLDWGWSLRVGAAAGVEITLR